MNASAPSASQLSLNQSVSAAVRELNESGYAGPGREVTFSSDPGSHAPVVKVIDSQTNEVINQWPPEYVLELAKDAQAYHKTFRMNPYIEQKILSADPL